MLLSFRNNLLLEGDSEEVEGALWALVFLGMVLGQGQRHKAEQNKTKQNKKKKKNQGQTAS